MSFSFLAWKLKWWLLRKFFCVTFKAMIRSSSWNFSQHLSHFDSEKKKNNQMISSSSCNGYTPEWFQVLNSSESFNEIFHTIGKFFTFPIFLLSENLLWNLQVPPPTYLFKICSRLHKQINSSYFQTLLCDFLKS